ncbi:MAG: DNA-directed RNA polymerase subunit alpha C-terminal domain-containing protein [Planctomycetota bacterium]|nr:DNA-directed RNA polymerase subunit alpha C-terminal domain-containing protein [Planctomycetota bacterium]
MSQGLEIELKDVLLSNSSFGPNEITFVSDRISNDYTQFPILRDVTQQLEAQADRSPATNVRLGICKFLQGDYSAAIETLENADGGALAYFYQGRSQFALNHFPAAIECFQAAKTAGYDGDVCQLAIAECERHNGNYDGAMSILDNMFGPIEQTAEYLYQRGATIAAMGNNPNEVIALYERAVELDEKHPGALFGLALENDRRGNDERAMELYQRAAAVFPTNIGALLNLGLLYEDHDQNERAARCYDRVLESFPTHPQAKLYRGDAIASLDGPYDANKIREEQQMASVMGISISQFELSVRSRNCLQKMGIQTLGDLTKVSESELLGSKNFGETSLVEIREMMANKGLMVGQFSHEKEEELEPIDISSLSPDEQAFLDRPMSDLNLSVRARKCMTRLGLTTIGELIRKSGDDLLECKNFGVTSLTEIREKLDQVGLKLRGD